MRVRYVLILGVALLLPSGGIRAEKDTVLALRIRAVSGEDAEAAGEACGALGRDGRPTVVVVAALRAALDRPDRALAAAVALSRLGLAAAEAIPVLRGALAGEGRVPAIRALGRYGPAACTALPEIVDALSHPETKRVAEGALRTVGDDVLAARRAALVRKRVRVVIEGLADVHGSRFTDHAEEMGGLGRHAVRPLIEALDDERQPLRVTVILALARLGPLAAPAVPRLGPLLASGDSGIATSAARVLGRIGPAAAAAMPALRRALRAEDPMLRVAASFALWRLGESADVPVPVMIRALREPEPAASSAVTALAWMGPSAAAAVPALLEILAGEEGPPRAAAARALGRIWTEAPRIAPALARALGHEKTWVREAAAQALTRLGQDAQPYVPALVRALEDENRGVRRAVARALGHLVPDDERVVSALVRCLADEDGGVARAAAQALAWFGAAAGPAVPALLEQAKGMPSNHDHHVLASIGAPAIPFLVDALGSRDEALRSLALDVAFWNGTELPPSAIPHLLRMLEEEEPPSPIWVVAEILGRTGRGAVRHLLRLAEHEDPDRRVAAACGIGAFRECPAEARVALLRLVADPDEDVRCTAIDRVEDLAARGQISAPRALPVLLEAFRAAASEDRCWIADALGAFGPEGVWAVRALSDSLGAEDSDLVRSAMSALERIGPGAAAALPALARVVRVESVDLRLRAVRTIAAVAAIATGAGCHLPVLRDARMDPNVRVRVEAARALLLLGGSRGPSRAVLLSALREDRSAGRVTACVALGEGGFNDAEIVAALAAALGDPEESVHVAAAGALGRLGPAAAPAVSHLVFLLRAWETGIHGGSRAGCIAAATAMGAIGPAAGEAIPALDRAARFGPEGLRPHANDALRGVRRR